jgi:hypothetical protein
MERPQNPIPAALPELFQIAVAALRDSTGINLEILGLVEKDQPGILEHMRKQAGMTVLASLFDSLRRYRKEQGRLMLWYITTFLSDGRLIKIGGAEDSKYIPLLRQPDTVEYDVIVDDTPTSPNLKERVWATLVQMMPFLRDIGMPAPIYLELLKYSPFPETVVAKIAQIAQSQQTQQKPDPNMIVAEGMAAKNTAQAGLFKAQTAKTMQDAIMGSHQVAAENAKTQVEAAKAVLSAQDARMKLEESKAKIENLRAAALPIWRRPEPLKRASRLTSHDDPDALDSLMGWHHTQQQIDIAADPPMAQAGCLASLWD